MDVVSSRLSLSAIYLGTALVLTSVVLGVLDAPRPLINVGITIAAFSIVSGVIGSAFGPAARTSLAVVARRPVSTDWGTLNDPRHRVPSHGTHAWGQAYAVDFWRPGHPDQASVLGSGGGFARPESFLAFGQAVRAPVSGRVVVQVDGARDHRCRLGGMARLWFHIEGVVRAFMGPRALFGNYIIIEKTNTEYVLLAHLQRKSSIVTIGDYVQDGQELAKCGNSGNSTEPHVHFQCQDKKRPLFARGMPFKFV